MVEVAERTIKCNTVGKIEAEVVVPEELLLYSTPEIDEEALLTLAQGMVTDVEDTHLTKDTDVHAQFGFMRVMTRDDGDERIVWCRRVMAQITVAKKMFMDLIKQGMVPYKVGTDGKASVEEMKEFDPLAEEVVFMPIKQIGGG